MTSLPEQEQSTQDDDKEKMMKDAAASSDEAAARKLYSHMSTESLDHLMGSVARISLASLGGGLVGLGLENQQSFQRQQVPMSRSTSPFPSANAKASKAAAAAARNTKTMPPGTPQNFRAPRRGPPIAMGVTGARSAALSNPATGLPKKWAISCMLFAIVLESSRLASPSSFLLDSMWDSSDTEEDGSSPFDQKMKRTAYKAVGDYTFGGAMAGLAGALGRRRTASSSPFQQSPDQPGSAEFRLRMPRTILQAGRRPLVVYGVGVGITLGMMAGIIQAAVDVGDMYIEEQQLQQEQQDEDGATHTDYQDK